jgi:hypothetical protein
MVVDDGRTRISASGDHEYSRFDSMEVQGLEEWFPVYRRTILPSPS